MNEIMNDFSQWMKQTTGLSDSSIYKYSVIEKTSKHFTKLEL